MSEKNLITYLQEKNFVQIKEMDDKSIYHLTTPCRFQVLSKVVSDLKQNYRSEEEIGGILWAKPTLVGEEMVYVIHKVDFIRNAIEDKPRTDHRNKSNAYLEDRRELTDLLRKIFSSHELPISFHTHPIKGTNPIHILTNPELMTETSEQDRRESNIPHVLENQNLLLPRALIVGNNIGSDIFIGLYNGFIAPKEFKDSKQKLQTENLKSFFDSISEVKLSNWEKVGVGLAAGLLLFAMIRHPKQTFPAILGVALVVPSIATSTQNLKESNYFSKLTFGDANIFIPKLD